MTSLPRPSKPAAVLTGEHGIGLEKREYMGMMFSAHDMYTQDVVRETFDPDGLANPLKIIPSGSRCSDSFHQHVPRRCLGVSSQPSSAGAPPSAPCEHRAARCRCQPRREHCRGGDGGLPARSAAAIRVHQWWAPQDAIGERRRMFRMQGRVKSVHPRAYGSTSRRR